MSNENFETRDETRPRVRTTTNGRRGVSTREGGNCEPFLGNLREPDIFASLPSPLLAIFFAIFR